MELADVAKAFDGEFVGKFGHDINTSTNTAVIAQAAPANLPTAAKTKIAAIIATRNASVILCTIFSAPREVYVGMPAAPSRSHDGSNRSARRDGAEQHRLKRRAVVKIETHHAIVRVDNRRPPEKIRDDVDPFTVQTKPPPLLIVAIRRECCVANDIVGQRRAQMSDGCRIIRR